MSQNLPPITAPAAMPRGILDAGFPHALVLVLLLLGAHSRLHGAPLLLNEYNGVGSSRYLLVDSPLLVTNADTHFGRVAGNGGNWFELVVTANHLDVRGWQLRWAYYRDPFTYGSGVLALTQHDLWRDLPAGLIVTFTERGTSTGGLDTDLGRDPETEDWWINIRSSDAALVTATGTLIEGGLDYPVLPGEFVVNNNDWSLEILDASGRSVFGPAGEGSLAWSGGGVSGNEIGYLQADPSPWITPAADYRDGVVSTFGAPNVFYGGARTQDFSALRRDAGNALRIASLQRNTNAPGWKVAWSSYAAQNYLLQRRDGDAAAGSPWVDVAHRRAIGSLTWAEDPDLSVPMRLYRVALPLPAPDAAVAFEPPGGYQAGSVLMNLVNPLGGGTVHYTLDGSEPDLQSPRFTGTFSLGRSSVLRASVFLPGRLPTTPASALYLIGANLHLPVVALATAPANLFDPATGLLNNPTDTGIEWERSADLILFPDQGQPPQSMPVGLRVHGGASRLNPKPSWRVYPRPSAVPPAFNRPLFSAKPSITNLEALIIRGGATDGWVPAWSLLRDPLMHSLFADLGGPHSACTFVNLFLNADYWGIYTLRERIDASYVLNNFGLTNADLIKFEDEAPQSVLGDLVAWNNLTNYLATTPLIQEGAFRLIAAQLDLDNVTDYHLLEIYGGNLDWPQNNVCLLRDRTPAARWRFVLWDTDLTFGLPWWDLDQATHDTLAWATRATPRPDLAPPWLNGPDQREASGTVLWSTLLLRSLLANPSYQTRFINRCADLLNSTLGSNAVIARIGSLQDALWPNIGADVTRWDRTAGVAVWATNVDQMRRFAERRPAVLRDAVVRQFNLEGIAAIHLAVAEGQGSLQIHTLPPVTQPWTGLYFRGIPVTVRALPAPGFRFVGWVDPSFPNVPEITVVPRGAELDFEARFAP